MKKVFFSGLLVAAALQLHAQNSATYFNTADQTTNYEKLVQQWSSNIFEMGTYFGGTGSPRKLRLGITTAASATNLSSGRHLTFSASPIGGIGMFDFNGSTAVTGSLLSLNTGLAGSASMQNMLAVQGKVDQAGTAGYRGVFISPYENALGTGPKYLIDAGTNSAVSATGTHTSKFVVTNIGSVGIGTALPTNPLTVFGSDNLANGTVAQFNGNNPIERARINIANTAISPNHNASSSIVYSGYNLAGTAVEAKWEVGTDLNLIGGKDLYFFNNSTQNIQMMLYDSGSVGVSSVSPIAQFQVDDGVSSVSLGNANGPDLSFGTGYIGFNASRSGSNWSVAGDGVNNGGGVVYGDIKGNINFASLGRDGTAARNLTDNAVREKISFQIAADGTTRAKKIVVETQNWPDYVFKENFKLMPLDQLEKYTKRENHLPGIPSAKEVQTAGIDLAVMNKVLLKKVEELTLYVISLDKKIKEINRAHNKVSKVKQRSSNKRTSK